MKLIGLVILLLIAVCFLPASAIPPVDHTKVPQQRAPQAQQAPRTTAAAAPIASAPPKPKSAGSQRLSGDAAVQALKKDPALLARATKLSGWTSQKLLSELKKDSTLHLDTRTGAMLFVDTFRNGGELPPP